MAVGCQTVQFALSSKYLHRQLVSTKYVAGKDKKSCYIQHDAVLEFEQNANGGLGDLIPAAEASKVRYACD